MWMWVFYFFAAALVWQGVVSLRGGWRFLAYVRGEMGGRGGTEFAPFASVVVPCRGLDQGLRENFLALFAQDYPAYELLFVTDCADDAALVVLADVRRQMHGRGAHVKAQVVVAGEATESGQKVHNLRAALREADPSSGVFVFVDTDARPRRDWLKSLVAPLADEQTGATTGYRWFVPVRGGLASHLRSVWNASIASALGERGDRNFCWGGSTAIRRATFEKLNMMEEWRGALSDDFALMRALRRAGLPIKFVPNCLTASYEDCGFGELLEFTTRQLKITRVYAPHFWKAVLFGSLLFVLVFFGGLALVVWRAAAGLNYAAPLLFLVAIYALGAAKAALRWRAVSLPLGARAVLSRRSFLAHLLLWPLASVIYLYNALAALASRRIEWRGISYELKSPTETIVITPLARVK